MVVSTWDEHWKFTVIRFNSEDRKIIIISIIIIIIVARENLYQGSRWNSMLWYGILPILCYDMLQYAMAGYTMLSHAINWFKNQWVLGERLKKPKQSNETWSVDDIIDMWGKREERRPPIKRGNGWSGWILTPPPRKTQSKTAGRGPKHSERLVVVDKCHKVHTNGCKPKGQERKR